MRTPKKRQTLSFLDWLVALESEADLEDHKALFIKVSFFFPSILMSVMF